MPLFSTLAKSVVRIINEKLNLCMLCRVLSFSLAIHANTTKLENCICPKLFYLSMIIYCVQVQYHNCHDGPYLPHQFLVFSCQVRMKIVKILLSVHFVINTANNFRNHFATSYFAQPDSAKFKVKLGRLASDSRGDELSFIFIYIL